MSSTTLTAPLAAAPEAQHTRGLGVPAGVRCASPILVLLLLGFVAPLLMVVGYAFATPRSFEVFTSFSWDNFATIFDSSGSVWTSFAWSIGLALLCTAILAVIAYPIAYGLNHVFGKWSSLVSLLFVFPLFVSENVRLYGWVQFFIKGGMLDGTLKMWGFDGGPEVLYTPAVTLFGMVYVYLPFMLFPMSLGLSMVPRDLIDAAADLGASRWQIFREITLPLLWPGIWSGALFAFLLSWGNFPLSLYTAGADSTVPKWLYAKMVAGYTPMVPALGTMSTLGAVAVLMLVGFVMWSWRKARNA